MTFTIFGGYTNVAAGNAFTMANGDQLQTLGGTVLASSVGSGVAATGGVAVEIGGTVGGNQGIYDVLTSGQQSHFFIEKTGNVFSSDGGYGLDITGTGGSSYVDNAGAIQSIGVNGWGIFSSDASQVVNQATGVITAGIAVLLNDATATDTSYFSNFGSVYGETDAYVGGGAKGFVDNAGLMAGNVAMGSNAGSALFNSGTMAASSNSNSTAFSVGDSTVTNVGTIYQSVTSASGVTMMQFANATGDHVTNFGTITEYSAGGGNSSSNAIAFGNGAGDYVYNAAGGSIYGNIRLGTGASDAVYNNGSIGGYVGLGNGANALYSGQNGTIVGVICGTGGDWVYSGSDSETVNAGLGNDHITAGKSGALTIYEGAAAQANNGWDSVYNFQTLNAASGSATYLHLDASMASTAFFNSDGAGGTLISMALGGGSNSYIDVIGVGVSTVRAQTYFA